MDITYFYGKKSTKPISDKTDKNDNEFYDKVKMLLINKNITIDEYNLILDFMKNGRLVNFVKLNNLIKKINDQVFYKSCQKYFKNYYDVIDDDSTNINIGKVMQKMERFEYTDDQKTAIRKMMNFLTSDNARTFGLYGYAGTGKTTLITKFIIFLLTNKYIRSVAFAAPTNKAVNIIKARFRSDMEINNKDGNNSFDDMIEMLSKKGLTIEFQTIHKLLHFKNEFDTEGDRVFVRNENKSKKINYDLVIVDECSMVPFSINAHIFDSLKNLSSNTKVLFVGDPAQLPPVNEKVSIIFSKKIEDFSYELFKKALPDDSTFYKDAETLCKSKFVSFRKEVIEQETATLSQVVRSNDNNVVGLCNNVRTWVIGESDYPKIGQYKGSKVKLYKFSEQDKLHTNWFKNCLEKFKTSNTIILTWTNRQSDEYNNAVRKMLFGKDKLEKYEVGDILMLNDFYNIKEKETNVESENKNKFYTSEQIKVVKVDAVTKAVPEFPDVLNKKKLRIMENFAFIEDKFLKCTRNINKNTLRKYDTWKLSVMKIGDEAGHIYKIYVLKDEDRLKLNKDKLFSSQKIKELRNEYQKIIKEQSDLIDRKIIKPLWKEWNNRFEEPFCNVNYGNSISVHKGQGSNYYNVFVDAHDIFKNPNNNEAKRCIYTALTRTSNELHVLI